ncbi:MAG: hypothetical protein EZS28_039982 [Streblomastix strix]|uniref:Uncharacterized protein n=1 Tax=Streblomastix strix TaxID=222440 RepID=A0A5J4U2V1_9EUKA|nr:MAG: hypothetical protein EZS28_039982 [Streblomastix strix]
MWHSYFRNYFIQKVKTKNNQRMNQKESQLMEQITMETKAYLSNPSNLSISLTKTMDSERMAAGCSYKPLSTEKRTQRSISQKFMQTLHFTIQTDQMDSEETFVGHSYRQQPTKMDPQTIRQSITLAMRTITRKLMIIESEEMKTDKDPAVKTNMNKELNFKIMEILNQNGQDPFTQPIPNMNRMRRGLVRG